MIIFQFFVRMTFFWGHAHCMRPYIDVNHFKDPTYIYYYKGPYNLHPVYRDDFICIII